MIGCDPFTVNCQPGAGNEAAEMFDGEAVGIEDTELFAGGKRDLIPEIIDYFRASKREIRLDSLEGRIRFGWDERKLQRAISRSDIEVGKRAEEPMASGWIVVLGEDALERGTIVVRGSEVCADDQVVLGSNGINDGAKYFRGPAIVNGAEEQDDTLGAGRIEVLEESRKDRAVADFAKERGALQSTKGGGGGMFSGEHHFKADVCRSVNDGAAGLANQLEAAGVLGAVAAGDADHVNDIAAAKFGGASKC